MRIYWIFLLVLLADNAREYQTARISPGYIVYKHGKKLKLLDFQWNWTFNYVFQALNFYLQASPF